MFGVFSRRRQAFPCAAPFFSMRIAPARPSLNVNAPYFFPFLEDGFSKPLR